MFDRPQASLLLTGSELTQGATADTNGPFMARRLTTLGVEVVELRLLPDDPTRLELGFRQAVADHDVVLVSGGLGPTEDDHTVAVMARAVGRSVRRDAEADASMRQRALDRYGSLDKIPGNYFKQAEVVDGSHVLQNTVGLAPGFVIETERGLAAVMPGVPHELRTMFDGAVLDAIERRFELRRPRIVRAKIVGLGESVVESRIQALGLDGERVEYGISARPGEMLVKLIARQPENHSYLDHLVGRLEDEFGADLIALPEGLVDDSGEAIELSHAQLVHELLLEAGVTLATAESCTGGLIAKRLTDYPGSSAYLLGAVVAYQNEVKSSLLGVERDTLERHGAVSAEVCRQMAGGARDRFGADYALAVTGVAGPGGGSDDKPVGLVFIGLATPDGAVEVVESRLPGNRGHVRAISAVRALDMLRRSLSERR